MAEDQIGVLNDPEDFDEDTTPRLYEIQIDIPLRIRVWAENEMDAEDMALDHLYDSMSFSDLVMGADVLVEEVTEDE